MEICKFRNENGDNNWRLAKGNPAECIFEGNAKQYQIGENYHCRLKITADAGAAGIILSFTAFTETFGSIRIFK